MRNVLGSMRETIQEKRQRMVLFKNQNTPGEILSSIIQNSSQMLVTSNLGLVMSIPTNLLRLFSPTLWSLLDDRPCVTSSIIIPDTNIKTLSVLVELLMSGKTNQDFPSLVSTVTDLAEMLGIANFNIGPQDENNSGVEEAEPVQRGGEGANIKQEEKSHCCAICFKSFSSSITLGFHYCKHFNNNLDHLDLSDLIEASASTRCVPCKKTFPDRKAILSHVGVRHQRLNEILRSNGIDELDLGRRLLTETDTTRSCFLCSDNLRNSSEKSLAKHYCRHYESELSEYFATFRTNNSCNLCKRYFPEDSALLFHIGVKHGKINKLLSAHSIPTINFTKNQTKRINTPEEADINVGNKSLCFKCRKSFPTLNSLRVHVCSHFSEELKEFIKEGKTCGICSETSCSSQALLRHVGVTHGKLEDILSSQGWPSLHIAGRRSKGSSTSTKAPRGRKNDDVKQLFRCEICEKEQANSSVLTQHMITSHNFLKDIKKRYESLYQDSRCGLCQKVLPKTSIWQHLGNIHNKLDEFLIEKGLRPLRWQSRNIKSEVSSEAEPETADDNNFIGSLFEDVDKNLLEMNARFNK